MSFNFRFNERIDVYESNASTSVRALRELARGLKHLEHLKGEQIYISSVSINWVESEYVATAYVLGDLD